MSNQQLLTIIVSLGGLILTVALTLAGLIVAQSRATRSELQDIRNQIGETPGAHGAPGEPAGRSARSYHRTGQGQLGPSAV